MIHLGLGRRMWYLSPEVLMQLSKRMFAVNYLYNMVLTLTKSSCLLFYTRIFKGSRASKTFSRAIWAAHILNIAIFVGTLFTITFTLSPHAQANSASRPSIANVWLGNAVPSVSMDFILLIFPIPIIWKLRVGQWKKLAIIFVFFCGYRQVSRKTSVKSLLNMQCHHNFTWSSNHHYQRHKAKDYR